MARPLRIEFPGANYHITSRGNARLPIFEDQEDMERFLDIFQEAVTRFNWLCHAYCLMGNHYHLLVETLDANLSQGMRHINGVYTQRFNRRHCRVGHVFQGRYKAILVDRENYFLELCRYIVLNPVRAGMSNDMESYRWSSYRATAGFSKRPSFLTVQSVLEQFASQRREARKRYRDFVMAGINEPSPWKHLRSQCILGSREFVERMASALKDKSELTEIPKRERLAFRPSLETLFDAEATRDKEQRNKAIVSAHLEYGYSLSEIGRHLGLRYTTISTVVNKRSRQPDN